MQKIRSLKAAGIFILTIYSCGSIIDRQENTIRGIMVTQVFPEINKDGRLLRYDTSRVNIYYYRDQILYNDLYNWVTLYNSIVVNWEIRQNFFVYTPGNKHGLFYDKYKSELDKKILVDSMLNLQWYTKFKLSPASLNLISEEHYLDSGILRRLYSFKGKADSLIKGTVFLSFNKRLKGIDFSLAKELDTVNKMRLYKMRNTTYGRHFKDYNFTIDTLEQEFKLEEIPVTNKSEILYYFDRERKYNKKD